MGEAFLFCYNLYMDQTNLEYRHVGNKTLAFFIIRKLGLFFLTLLLIIVLAISSQFVPLQYASMLTSLIPYLLLVLLFFLIFGSIEGWFQYSHYSMILSDEDMTITQGFVSQEEIGIPYRRVKEIQIERDVINELAGLSDVVIIIQGAEESGATTERRVILPSLPKDVALRIQNKILGKAEVQEMTLDK